MAPQIDLMLGNFWTNLLYVNNFIPVQEQFMGWCWSLAIEEQFYLLVPLFIVGLFKWIKQKVWFFIILFKKLCTNSRYKRTASSIHRCLGALLCSFIYIAWIVS